MEVYGKVIMTMMVIKECVSIIYYPMEIMGIKMN